MGQLSTLSWNATGIYGSNSYTHTNIHVLPHTYTHTAKGYMDQRVHTTNWHNTHNWQQHPDTNTQKKMKPIASSATSTPFHNSVRGRQWGSYIQTKTKTTLFTDRLLNTAHFTHTLCPDPNRRQATVCQAIFCSTFNTNIELLFITSALRAQI